MTKFWGKLFVINFVLGVVTGITLEFQFGTNWSRYSEYVGDIFGSLPAIEATLAFFLESTFLGVWIFGWNRVSPKLHLTSIWLVAIASNLSALWIILANGFMQHPVGYVIRNGRAELESFMAVLTIFGTALFGVIGIYPALLPSSLDPAYSMTVTNSSSSTLTLKIMLGVALVFVPIVILYQLWAYKTFSHTITDQELAEHGY